MCQGGSGDYMKGGQDIGDGRLALTVYPSHDYVVYTTLASFSWNPWHKIHPRYR